MTQTLSSIQSEETPVYCARVMPQGGSRAKHVPLTDKEIVDRARQILRDRAAKTANGTSLTSPQEVVRLLQDHFLGCEREEFVIMMLNSRHQLIAIETMFQGTINAAPVYPREIIKRLLEVNAAAVMLAHNHPSGTTEPSQADIRVTARIKEVLMTIDVPLLDHIIIDPHANVTAMSFAERGLL